MADFNFDLMYERVRARSFPSIYSLARLDCISFPFETIKFSDHSRVVSYEKIKCTAGQVIRGEKCLNRSDLGKDSLAEGPTGFNQVQAYSKPNHKFTNPTGIYSDCFDSRYFFETSVKVPDPISRNKMQDNLTKDLEAFEASLIVLSDGMGTMLPPFDLMYLHKPIPLGFSDPSNKFGWRDVGTKSGSWRLTRAEVVSLRKLFSEYYLNRPSVDFALRRYVSSRKTLNVDDRLVNLVVALEALLEPDNESGVSFRIALKAAHLIGQTIEERQHLYRTVKDSYDVRSKIVHGSKRSANPNRKPDKGTFKVNEVSELVQKLCPIVRKCCLARLLQFSSLDDEKLAQHLLGLMLK